MGLVKGVHPSHSYYDKMKVQAPLAIQQSALPTINHQQQEKTIKEENDENFTKNRIATILVRFPAHRTTKPDHHRYD